MSNQNTPVVPPVVNNDGSSSSTSTDGDNSGGTPSSTISGNSLSLNDDDEVLPSRRILSSAARIANNMVKKGANAAVTVGGAIGTGATTVAGGISTAASAMGTGVSAAGRAAGNVVKKLGISSKKKSDDLNDVDVEHNSEEKSSSVSNLSETDGTSGSSSEESMHSEEDDKKLESIITNEVNDARLLIGMKPIENRSVNISHIVQLFNLTLKEIRENRGNLGFTEKNKHDFMRKRKEIFELLSPEEQSILMQSINKSAQDRIVKGSYHVECINKNETIAIKITDNKNKSKYMLLILDEHGKFVRQKFEKINEDNQSLTWVNRKPLSKDDLKKKNKLKREIDSIKKSFNQNRFSPEENFSSFYLSKTLVENKDGKIDLEKLEDAIFKKLKLNRYQRENESTDADYNDIFPDLPSAYELHSKSNQVNVSIGDRNSNSARLPALKNMEILQKALKFLNEDLTYGGHKAQIENNSIFYKEGDVTTRYTFEDNKVNFSKSSNQYTVDDFKQMLSTIHAAYGNDAKIDFTNVPENARANLRKAINDNLEDTSDENLEKSYEGALESLDKLSKDESSEKVPSDDEERQGFLIELKKLRKELSDAIGEVGSSMRDQKRYALPKIVEAIANLEKGKDYDKDSLEQEISSYKLAIRQAKEEDLASSAKRNYPRK